jgi:hypothetical protein
VKGKRYNPYPDALPIGSVNSEQEAKDLIVLVGCASYDEKRYCITPMSGFERGNINSMDVAGKYIEDMYQILRSRTTR